MRRDGTGEGLLWKPKAVCSLAHLGENGLYIVSVNGLYTQVHEGELDVKGLNTSIVVSSTLIERFSRVIQIGGVLLYI